jgi:ferrous iron transport protein A
MSAPPVIPIDSLSPNDEGVIVDMEGDPCFVKRLQEIGVHVGCSLRMVCQGSPCMVCVDGRRLSLRLDDSAEIYVSTVDKSE